MKTLSLRQDILSCSPRGFARPLSHAESFTEPLELSSGLANANIATSADGKPLHDRNGNVCKIIDNLPEFTPGTFAKVGGRLVKAGSRSTIHNQRWNNATTAARAHKHNPRSYQHLPTVKQREAALHEEMEARQTKAIKDLCKRYKIKRPRSRTPQPPAGFIPPPPPTPEQITAFRAGRKPGEHFLHWLHRTA